MEMKGKRWSEEDSELLLSLINENIEGLKKAKGNKDKKIVYFTSDIFLDILQNGKQFQSFTLFVCA